MIVPARDSVSVLSLPAAPFHLLGNATLTACGFREGLNYSSLGRLGQGALYVSEGKTPSLTFQCGLCCARKLNELTGSSEWTLGILPRFVVKTLGRASVSLTITPTPTTQMGRISATFPWKDLEGFVYQ